ncbi:hypothetical protein [Cellulomonas sp. S1-8]|uniref:hypothetical protein n=1 Tax=Cellulomonas sp. S1-8 TaxID=2904790 RepID=UPI00224368E6|nr:hypothetical protein [Cellulomonas sp. S1-8]UZN02967.1 hypothetical protein OKX07_18240 [Cellulomonas sp. S1-8]
MRMVVLAVEAEKTGCRATIAVMDDEQEDAVRARGVDCVRYLDWSEALDPWLVWSDPGYWLTAIGNDRVTLRETGADLVVVDSRLSMTVAAGLEDCRAVAVVQDMDFPDYVYPGRGRREDLWDGVSVALREALRAHGIDWTHDDPREVVVDAGVVVPGTPESDDVPARHRGSARFVGPLTGYADAPSDDGLPERGAVLLYKTLSTRSDLGAFRAAFEDLMPRVHVATGSAREAQALAAAPELAGAHVAESWNVTGPHAARLAAAVIHGGHGTMLHMAQAGVPCLVVPDLSPERYANACKAGRFGSMRAVLDGLDPADLTWSAQSSSDGAADFAAVRRELDALLQDAGAHARAAHLATAYADHTVERAWREVLDVATVPRTARLPVDATAAAGPRDAG